MPTETATFFSVLLPQCGQKSRVISEVVLERTEKLLSALGLHWVAFSGVRCRPFCRHPTPTPQQLS